MVCLLLISANRVSSELRLIANPIPLSAEDVTVVVKKNQSITNSKSPPSSNREFNSDTALPDVAVAL